MQACGDLAPGGIQEASETNSARAGRSGGDGVGETRASLAAAAWMPEVASASGRGPGRDGNSDRAGQVFQGFEEGRAVDQKEAEGRAAHHGGHASLSDVSEPAEGFGLQEGSRRVGE